LKNIAYKEIDLCDIVLCIIGRKFGTESKDGISSITQKELKAALSQNKQVYIFVERSVHAEFSDLPQK